MTPLLPAACLLAALASLPAAAGTIYTFGLYHGDGKTPIGGVLPDAKGNLYGVTELGGANGQGAAYELSPPTHSPAQWTEQLLFSFGAYAGDVANPTADLLADSSGNYYGTATTAGAARYGGVFELSPPPQGSTTWSEQVLYSFDDTDGANPAAGLIADPAGNLYGTTRDGGANGVGIVFELVRPASGETSWTESILHTFGASLNDGAFPLCKLVMDGSGNLYGTTEGGGAGAEGTVFELSPPPVGQGSWTETLLYTFASATGAQPFAGVILAGDNDLYGTTAFGGTYGQGTVFRLSPPTAAAGQWRIAVLHAFAGLQDGAQPEAALAVASTGLYGTTANGGSGTSPCNPCGTVFKLIPPAGGGRQWIETVFPAGPTGGQTPLSDLSAGLDNALYGTASSSGSQLHAGTVFDQPQAVKASPARPTPLSQPSADVTGPVLHLQGQRR